MKRFKATIKEMGKDGKVHILYPEFIGDVSREYVIDFFGLNKPDVLGLRLYEFNE